MATTTKAGVATSHVKRVTLNLIRHAASCPKKLRPVLEKLAAKDWDLAKLEQAEVETIYARVDDAVAEKARNEFEADLQTVIDHNMDAGPSAGAYCKLCGHEDIRFEFLLRNNRGGKEVWTGSRCIIEYGINVLGEETAEAALAALKAVISEKKREYDRHIWREEHPDHPARIHLLRECVLEELSPYVDVEVWRKLPAGWIDSVREAQKQAEATIRYYEKHGYLLKNRTAMLYGKNSLIAEAKRLRGELAAASKAAKAA